MDTNVTFMLDSSGSMQSIEADTRGGFNSSLISINRNTELAGDSIAANDGREVSSGLPSTARTMFERLRLARFGETVTCVHCESDAVVNRGTTGKDAQQYWCKHCETYFNDLKDDFRPASLWSRRDVLYRQRDAIWSRPLRSLVTLIETTRLFSTTFTKCRT